MAKGSGPPVTPGHPVQTVVSEQDSVQPSWRRDSQPQAVAAPPSPPAGEPLLHAVSKPHGTEGPHFFSPRPPRPPT